MRKYCVLWQPRHHLKPLEKTFDERKEAVEFIDWGKNNDPETEYKLYRMTEENSLTPWEKIKQKQEWASQPEPKKETRITVKYREAHKEKHGE